LALAALGEDEPTPRLKAVRELFASNDALARIVEAVQVSTLMKEPPSTL
jgi:hypothetical protein